MFSSTLLFYAILTHSCSLPKDRAQKHTIYIILSKSVTRDASGKPRTHVLVPAGTDLISSLSRNSLLTPSSYHHHIT